MVTRISSSTPRPAGPGPAPGPRRRSRQMAGVEANARLTGTLGLVLLVLLAAEGFTILSVRSLLAAHVFIGMLIVPPIVLKVGSTSWRFVRYYAGSPAYRRKGPPPPLLRLLGPVVIVLTGAVVVSGVALLAAPPSGIGFLLSLHQASFVLWFFAMALHVVGHLLDTAKLAPRDFYWRTRRQVRGAGLRQWALAVSVVAGIVLGSIMAPKAGAFLHAFYGVH